MFAPNDASYVRPDDDSEVRSAADLWLIRKAEAEDGVVLQDDGAADALFA
jgi:uncharacterized protein YaiI (UPF0178 family)